MGKRAEVPPILIDVDPVHGAHSRPRGASSLLSLSDAKAGFLNHPRIQVRPGDREAAWSKSWRAAVQRNSPYARSLPEFERKTIRQGSREATEAILQDYATPVDEARHEQHIIKLSEDISRNFGSRLRNGRLTIGTSQKFLNLYLKYLWCFDQVEEPPHCPFDRQVQKNAGFKASVIVPWTKIDTIEDYHRQIKRLQDVAAAHPPEGFSLAEWELRFGWS
jgi:hypothetical protein